MQQSTISRLPLSRTPVIAHDRIGGNDQGVIPHPVEIFLPLLTVVYAVFEGTIRAKMSGKCEQVMYVMGLAYFCSSSFQVGITAHVSWSTPKVEYSLLTRLWYNK